MKTLTFGIVGCGIIANAHALAIQNTSGASLLGACSKTDASAEAFCDQYGLRKFESYEQMLNCPEIDAVSICTPSGDHASQIIAALEKGKHAVVEKPMCITLEEAEAVIEAQKRYGKRVGVIFQRRFCDAWWEAKRAVSEGHLGKIYSASLSMPYYRSQEYYNMAAWRGTWQHDGGGVLMNQGIHGIDFMCWLLGPVREVSGKIATLGHDIEVEDTAMAALRFESGALGSINATTCHAPGGPTKLTVVGEKGSIALEEETITQWNLSEPCRISVGNIPEGSNSYSPKGMPWENHARQFGNFVDAVLNGADLISDAREGRLSLEVILGIYQSSREGKSITP